MKRRTVKRVRTRKNKKVRKSRKVRKVRKTRVRKQRGGSYLGFDPKSAPGGYTTVLDPEMSDTPMLMKTEEYIHEKETQ